MQATADLAFPASRIGTRVVRRSAVHVEVIFFTALQRRSRRRLERVKSIPHRTQFDDTIEIYLGGSSMQHEIVSLQVQILAAENGRFLLTNVGAFLLVIDQRGKVGREGNGTKRKG